MTQLTPTTIIKLQDTKDTLHCHTESHTSNSLLENMFHMIYHVISQKVQGMYKTLASTSEYSGYYFCRTPILKQFTRSMCFKK